MDAILPGSVNPGIGSATGPSTSPRELLIAHLPLVNQITAFVCRRRRLTADQCEEFAGHVRLKLVENDYAILRNFQNRSSLRTYLAVVIERLFLDYQIAEWGRWRPSVRASERGDVGVLLDRLLTRDGLGFGEACAVVQTNHQLNVSRDELYAISLELPVRSTRRRRRISSGADDSVPAQGGHPDEGLKREEAGRAAARLKLALRASMAQLTPAERRLVDMRYREGRRVVEIARALGEPSKPLYRRLEQIVRKLRRPIRAAAERLGADADVFRVGDVSISW